MPRPGAAAALRTDDAALLGGIPLPPTLLDELWLSIGADGRRELLVRSTSGARGWSTLAGLTIVVDDLCAESTAYAARLGCDPLAIDPVEMEEAGLAQRFALGPCWLTLLTPADDTDAAAFLAEHGPGLYTLALRDQGSGTVHCERVSE